jgi:hypothetical protein
MHETIYLVFQIGIRIARHGGKVSNIKYVFNNNLFLFIY